MRVTWATLQWKVREWLARWVGEKVESISVLAASVRGEKMDDTG